ncbi:MAG: hypothetical protein ABL866_04270 [Devosia sp.]
MSQIVEPLTQHDALIWAWRLIVWASAAYLIVLGALIFLRPSIVHRFFDGFVSSTGVNFLEAALRLMIGLAFMGISPESKLPFVYFCFGAILTATAIPMMFLYHFHKRQAAWAIPFAKRILPLMGVCAIALGAAISWASQ